MDIKDGKTVKGVNFVNFRDAGDPVELGAAYSRAGADELVYLDITASHEGRKTFTELVRKIAENINIPFTVGGGINSLDDITAILNAGADKVSINSAAVKNPDLISQCVNYFGSQCIVVAVDAKFVDNDYYVFINAGKINAGKKLIEWVSEVERRGAGEILLTSMDFDGTQKGFDIKMNKIVSDSVKIPVIASGGAGPDFMHFVDVFKNTNVDAALAASIFHFDALSVNVLKSNLEDFGIVTRKTKSQV